MGKYEVLGILTVIRNSGDKRYLRYNEIHQLMTEQGLSCSYTAVWRAVNGLFSDGFLEVHKEGTLLSRTLSFRLKKPTVVHTSRMKRDYNIRGCKAENRSAPILGGE